MIGNFYPITKLKMEEENGLSSEPDYGKPKTQPNNSQGKITLYLLFSVFVVALGSAQFGFSISAPNYIINGITGKRPNGTEYNCMKFRYESFIKGCVNMNSTEKSLFLSIIYAGCILGSIFGGLLSDLIERKTSLLISNIFFIVGNMCLSLFSNVLLLIVGRFTIGKSKYLNFRYRSWYYFSRRTNISNRNSVH